MAVNAPEAGTVKEHLVNEEDTVTVGQDLLKLELGRNAEDTGKQEAGQKTTAPASDGQVTSSYPDPKGDDALHSSSQSSITVGEERKTPKHDQYPKTSGELQPTREKRGPTVSEAKKPENKSTDSHKVYGSREERRVCFCFEMICHTMLTAISKVKMNRMRLRIAERLKQSQNTAASLTTFNEVDMSSLMQFRKLYKDDILKRTGVKLGFMGAFSRACVLAIKDIPAINASIEGPHGGDTIVYRDYVDISVAVATEKGLVTPVVRNSETLALLGIEKAIADLGKKVTYALFSGGVFSPHLFC